MVIPLQIVFHNLAPSAAIEAEIRKRAEKLDQFSDQIMHCQVTVDVDGKHKQQGRLYEVRVDITVPGTQIAIGRVHRHEDVYVVIRDAFQAAARKLQDYVRCRRGYVKVHEVPLHGVVTKLFEEGYGFIETAAGQEYYFHRDNLVRPDFEHLQIGTEVQFLEEAAGEGLQAKRISAGRVQRLE
ncbi:MAG TPA: HPF/RaiA family ribosome-associated protein [Burkholderiaceae bacterium]|nr:HPF/RaiA family ribosome-associated protein [Burkholderiaceae bacterium]